MLEAKRRRRRVGGWGVGGCGGSGWGDGGVRKAGGGGVWEHTREGERREGSSDIVTHNLLE